MAAFFASLADGPYTVTLRFPVRRKKDETRWVEPERAAVGALTVAYFLRQVLQALLTWLVFLLLSGSANGPISCRGRALRIGGGIEEIEGRLVAVAEEVKRIDDL